MLLNMKISTYLGIEMEALGYEVHRQWSASNRVNTVPQAMNHTCDLLENQQGHIPVDPENTRRPK